MGSPDSRATPGPGAATPGPRKIIPLLPGVARPRGERRAAMQQAVVEVIRHLVLKAVPPEHRSPLFDQARALLAEAGWGLDELFQACEDGPARQALFRTLGLETLGPQACRPAARSREADMAEERASGQEVMLRGPVRPGQLLAPGPRGPPIGRRGLTGPNTLQRTFLPPWQDSPRRIRTARPPGRIPRVTKPSRTKGIGGDQWPRQPGM